MAVLTTAVGATVTPAAGDFIVQVTDGQCALMRSNNGSAPFAQVDTIGGVRPGAVIVSNPVAGAVYRLDALNGTQPNVSIDQ